MVMLVMAEPDLGTTLCFMLLLLGLLWMVGLPMRYFAGLFLVIAGVVTIFAVTESYRLQRLTTFLHPNLDPQNTGYHTLQGLYALSSGGIFGVGLGQGTSKYGWVPNANTDYVFAVVGEELGLLGCAVVLALFALFTYSAMRIALRSRDPFVRLVASGAAIWIAGQALINIGYVTALLPVTGIPLPFISNGGTSLILTCAVLGMLASFARHEPAAVQAATRAAAQGTTARWVRYLRLGTVRALPVRSGVTRSREAKSDSAKPGSAKSGSAKPGSASKAPKPAAVDKATAPSRVARAATVARPAPAPAARPAARKAAAASRTKPAPAASRAPERDSGRTASQPVARRRGA
jgi:cell division protein FtsW